MQKPVILYVDPNEGDRARVSDQLNKRYGGDYAVDCRPDAETALDRLRELKTAGGQAAVLLAACWLGESSGADFLDRAHALFPEARRGLLAHWGEPESAQQVLQAMARNQIDSFGPKPYVASDEDFHKFITDFLHDWSADHRPRFEFVKLVGEQWANRSYQLRDLLDRSGIPYGFYPVESPAALALLKEHNLSPDRLPVAVLHTGQALTQPDNRALAEALDLTTGFELDSDAPDRPVDLLIVGGGPAGLSAAVYAASEGLRTLLVERQAPGGQAGQSSLIRNYLGFPTGIAGAELAERAYRQAWLFGCQFRITPAVTGLEAHDGLFTAALDTGDQVQARAVLLAMGVEYRRLENPALERLTGRGVYYGAAVTEAAAMRGQPVFVVGGGNSAGQAALHLARYARQVTLLVRGESLAESMSDYLIQELETCGNVDIRYNISVSTCAGADRLETLTVEDRDGKVEELPAAGLFVLIGARPHTAWLPDTIARDRHGYILTGADLGDSWRHDRPPLTFETSLPGVFTAGDVRFRSVQRVASAVGEGAMAVTLIHRYFDQ